jgi:hypothetical protein
MRLRFGDEPVDACRVRRYLTEVRTTVSSKGQIVEKDFFVSIESESTDTL